MEEQTQVKLTPGVLLRVKFDSYYSFYNKDKIRTIIKGGDILVFLKGEALYDGRAKYYFLYKGKEIITFLGFGDKDLVHLTNNLEYYI